MTDFFRLKVAEIVKETKQAKSIVLTIPPALEKTFAWLAGQYVDVRINVAGKMLTRSYSISNDRQTKGLRLTVKGLYKGQVSNYLIKKLKVGQELEVSRPRGRFHLSQNEAVQQYVFFAAGSGITPIYAIICQLLNDGSQSKVSLFYANSNAKSIMFLKQLQTLTSQYPHRLTVDHCLSKTGFFDAIKPHYKGRADAGVINNFLAEKPINSAEISYYLCGPTAFMRMISETLTHAGVASNQIHQESFGVGVQKNLSVTGLEAQLDVDSHGVHKTIDVKANETLLAAMLRQGIDAPYSCEEGVCGNCMCQINEGKVAMIDNLFLTEEEEQNGKVLSCQALPQSKKVKIIL